MKTNKRAIALAVASLCALGATPAHAVKVAGDLLEVYGNLYPEYERSQFTAGPSGNNIAAGNLTTGTTSPFYNRTTAQGAAKASFTKLTWSQSYIGFKGQKQVKGLTVGYDLQAVTQPDTTDTSIFTATRDAFIFIGQEQIGRLQVGSFDTPYKAMGDRYRMLNVSSSNFVSTSNVLSQPAWKGGVTTFHTRTANQLQYISPRLYGVEAAIGYSVNPNNVVPSGTSQGTRLLSYGANWTYGPYYVSAQREEHRNYMAFSNSTAGPKTVAIANTTAGAFTSGRSNDHASRINFGYENFGLRVGLDLSMLEYNEDPNGLAGKFTQYKNKTAQVAVEYDLPMDFTVAANYAVGSKGRCTLSGGIGCSTGGLGGHMVSLGGLYRLDRGIGIFVLAAQYNNGVGAAYGSPGGVVTGGKVKDVAVGVSVRF